MSVELPLDNERYNAERLRLVEFVSRRTGLKLDRDIRFETFDDGGMGSFRVLRSTPLHSRLEQKVDEFHYIDKDNVGVLITAYSDGNEHISSIDFWKYDFSPLLSFPSNHELK